MCITVVFLVKLHIYVRIYSKILCYHANWFYLYILEFHIIFFPVIYVPFFFFFTMAMYYTQWGKKSVVLKNVYSTVEISKLLQPTV